jgi:predicted kinase
MYSAHLICIGGLSGSGKTTLAKLLAGAVPPAVHYDSDVLRKEMLGVPLDHTLSGDDYGIEVSTKVFEELDRRVRQSLSGGKTVIVSAIHTWPHYRDSRKALAGEMDARFHGIWLRADEKILLSRVDRRKNDASDVTAEFAKAQYKKYHGPVTDWTNIDTRHGPESMLAKALRIIRTPPKPKKSPPRRYSGF